MRIRLIRPAARRRVLAVLTAATAIACSLSAVSWARGTPASAGRPSGLRWVTSWSVRSGTKLLVSVYVPDPTGPVTNHPFTAQANYLADGDRTLTPTAEGYDATPCWMLIDGVDTRASGRVVGTVVTLGDSITGDADQRWPDHLARRLNALRGPTLSVANAGLGGNRLLAPREGQPYYGVPALARLDRDVFGRTAVRDVILLEGVNDIGYDASAADIIAADRQFIAQSHAQGLRSFGGTIMPFKGSVVWSKERENTRETVNAWIRNGHAFDGVIDFSAATADPNDPLALRPAYDSGDHLHPGDAGCRAMADAVRLPMLIGG